jgi:hypothetical protein
MSTRRRTSNRLWWLCGFVLLPVLLQAQTITPFPSRVQPRPALTANLESRSGQYQLTLDNNGDQEFRGRVVIRVGQVGEPSEAGQATLILPPNKTKSFSLNAGGLTGEHYTLQIFDQKGALVFYQVAPLRQASGPAQINLESITLSTHTPKLVISGPANPSALVAASPPPTPEVQIKPRLVAGAQDSDPFLLAFDLAAANALMNATLVISIGETKQSKPVSINHRAVVEFKLPEYLETNQIGYQLTRKDGGVVAEGTTNLDKLFADDHVTVADIRPDRVAYAPGETARLTIMLEGQSPHGFKLEILARDYTGKTFFTNTAYGNQGETVKEKEFTFTLPGEVKGPVIFEFKIYDGETGLLFDSGERELTIKATES